MNTYICGHRNPPHPISGKQSYGYRGCCYKCWLAMSKEVKKGNTTWDALLAAGKCGLPYAETKG